MRFVFLLYAALIMFNVSCFSQSCKEEVDSLNNTIYYRFPDKFPSYSGGLKKLRATIGKNIKYPGRCCLTGSVFVSFIVDIDGTIHHPKVVKGISNATYCDADGEALRVVRLLKEWIPGECNGEKVPVEIIIPISFSLD